MVDISQISEKEIVYKEYKNRRNRKAIWRECDQCGKQYKAPLFKLKNDNPKHGKFCSTTCANIDRNRTRSEKLDEKGRKEAQAISWDENLSYLSGLMASDGNLVKKHPRLQFTSSDKELINIVMEIIDNHIDKDTTKPICHTRQDSVWWAYRITSRKLYYFFINIGIKPNKSKIIGDIDIPDEFFSDFLRGEIDGDGSFCYCQANDSVYTTISSGSKQFLVFLKGKINRLITDNNQGSISNSSGCYNLTFSLYDTQKIYNYIYGNNPQFYLSRKYKKLKEFFDSFEGFQKRNANSLDNIRNNVNRKLSYRRGLDIIKNYHESDLSMPDLADQYNVDVHTIWDVLHLKHWTTRDLK